MAEPRDTYRRRNPWLTLIEKDGLHVLFEKQGADGKFQPMAFETLGDFVTWTKTEAPVGTFIPFQPGDVFEVVPPVERVVKRTAFVVAEEPTPEPVVAPEPKTVPGPAPLNAEPENPFEAEAVAPEDDEGPEPPPDRNATYA